MSDAPDVSGTPELEHAISADIELDLDGFAIENMEDPDAVRDAIETVEADHDATVWVEGKLPYYTLRVRWNGSTDAVRVDVFEMSETFEVTRTSRTSLSDYE